MRVYLPGCRVDILTMVPGRQRLAADRSSTSLLRSAKAHCNSLTCDCRKVRPTFAIKVKH
jgi:hypothetical protein